MVEINGVKMYDGEEVAALFNICPSTLAKMRAEGKILSVKLGRRKYTSEQSIRDYLNGVTLKNGNVVTK